METMKDLDAALEAVENENVVEEVTVDDTEAFDITVKNGLSTTKTTLYVTPENTLEQVFQNTAGTLGLDKQETNVIFTNERTGRASTDTKMTLREFDVLPDNVLTIRQDAKVAGY